MADNDPVTAGQGRPLGFLQPNTLASEYGRTKFLIDTLLSKVCTATIVEVSSCTVADALGLAGTVTVTPQVQLIDSLGNTYPHGFLFNLPYIRMQGGLSAIIMDPVAGDEGLAIFAQHDISTVLATKTQSPPGSRRKFSMADGIYLGGLLNAIPTQYIQMLANAAGINMVSPGTITINGVTFSPTGAVVAPGNITWNASTAATDAANHTHGGVQSGGSNTTKPNAGT